MITGWIYNWLVVSLVRNMNDIVSAIRKIVLDAVAAQKPTNTLYGTVISESPLKIQIDQKLILEDDHLKLTRAVQDYEAEISINGGTKQPCTVYNALKKGDSVTMIMAHGGQQFIVIDKE